MAYCSSLAQRGSQSQAMFKISKNLADFGQPWNPQLMHFEHFFSLGEINLQYVLFSTKKLIMSYFDPFNSGILDFSKAFLGRI